MTSYLNEAELLRLGLSRPTVAALRDIASVTAASESNFDLSQVQQLAFSIAFDVMSLASKNLELSGKVTALQGELENTRHELLAVKSQLASRIATLEIITSQQPAPDSTLERRLNNLEVAVWQP